MKKQLLFILPLFILLGLTGCKAGMARMQLLYDSLLDKDEDEDIPWLAKSWDISEDGTVYTFHLQENVLWHDGKPLTAEDVVFTFSYYREHPPVSNTSKASDCRRNQCYARPLHRCQPIAPPEGTSEHRRICDALYYT